MPIATDLLSLIFAGCFVFGLIFFVVTALLGSLGHSHTGHLAGHTGHVGHGHAMQHHAQGAKATASAQQGAHSLFGYINPTSIVLFLLGFGFFGYVFHNTTPLLLPLTLVIALGGGCLVAALLLALIGRIFGKSESSTVQDVTERVGLLGNVNSTILENEIGEVMYISPGGMRKTIPARSVDGRRYERGQEVVVVNVNRGIAEVDTWDHFLNEGEGPALSGHKGSYLKEPDLSQQSELDELRKLLEQSEPGEDSHSNSQKNL